MLAHAHAHPQRCLPTLCLLALPSPCPALSHPALILLLVHLPPATPLSSPSPYMCMPLSSLVQEWATEDLEEISPSVVPKATKIFVNGEPGSTVRYTPLYMLCMFETDDTSQCGRYSICDV
jgi:hypothetical protein